MIKLDLCAPSLLNFDNDEKKLKNWMSYISKMDLFTSEIKSFWDVKKSPVNKSKRENLWEPFSDFKPFLVLLCFDTKVLLSEINFNFNNLYQFSITKFVFGAINPHLIWKIYNFFNIVTELQLKKLCITFTFQQEVIAFKKQILLMWKAKKNTIR